MPLIVTMPSNASSSVFQPQVADTGLAPTLVAFPLFQIPLTTNPSFAFFQNGTRKLNHSAEPIWHLMVAPIP